MEVPLENSNMNGECMANVNNKKQNKLWLRVLSIIILLGISVILLVTVLFVNQRNSYQESYSAKDGYVSLENGTVYAEPVYLNGEWEAFEGVVCHSNKDVRNLKEPTSLIEFPLTRVKEAKEDATYRLRFSLPKGETSDLVAYIPTSFNSADVYLNGVKQKYVEDGVSWLNYSTMESAIVLSNIDTSEDYQELVITSAFSEQEITLLKKPIVIGTMKNISSLGSFSSSNEMFLFGLLLLVLINGYVFMLFRPNHKIISYMTLFDTMILMRTALSMNFVVAFIKDVFPWAIMSDQFNLSLSLFFLMLGGYVGCKLSTALYDPEGKAPQWFIKPLPILYLLFAIIFPTNLVFFEMYGKYILIVVYILTFIGVFLQFREGWKNKKRRTYNLLQFIKTAYIGALIFLDIMLWGETFDLLLLFYLYGSFFILHVIVRLYDNNESYQDVEVLNESLEDTVIQRTKELREANRILSELSIRDPLTNIFNRLHFEETVEEAEKKYHPETPIHLCMFDLDYFKNINDTYGHSVGDEQLKSMTRLVSSIVQDKATFARIGGEEFVLLFETLTKEEVLQCINEVHQAIAQDANQNEKNTTASFGVAVYKVGSSGKEMLKKADIALYEAKRLGRNCIVSNFDDTLQLVKK